MFDFTGERPSSLMTIPSSWMVEEPMNKVDKKISWCYWPKNESADEKQLEKLIKNSSDPFPESWSMLPGRIKGKFKSFEEAESYISEKIGTFTTSTDIENNGSTIEHCNCQAALLGSNKTNSMLNTRTLDSTPSTSKTGTKTLDSTPGTSRTGTRTLDDTDSCSSSTESSTITLVRTNSKALNNPSTSRISVSQAVRRPSLTGVYCFCICLQFH